MLLLASKYFQKKNISKLKVSLPTIIITVIVLCLPHGIFYQLYRTYEITNVKVGNFDDFLKALGIKSTEYITPEEVEVIKGKNIVVISVESLEEGFVGGKMSSITPNLTALSKHCTYFSNMPQSNGSTWTADSLYATKSVFLLSLKVKVMTFSKVQALHN